MTVTEHSDGDSNTRDLRAEIQGLVTFYHSMSTPGYWFSAGELEAMIDSRYLINLPERPLTMTRDEEYELGPQSCPRCGSSSRLFEMRSYLSSDVRLRACHVCHGRWIGHQSLQTLLEHIKYHGLFGKLKRLLHGRKKAASTAQSPES